MNDNSKDDLNKEPLIQKQADSLTAITNSKKQYSYTKVEDKNNDVLTNKEFDDDKTITIPKVDIKIPEILTNNKEYIKQMSKSDNLPEKKIVEHSKIQVHDYSQKKEVTNTNNNNIVIDIPDITNNQDNNDPNESTIEYIENLKKALRTTSSALKCPYCRKQVETEVTKTCSVINILCAIFSTPILWAGLKCCRGKDCNCYNAEHKCKRCKREIAQYSAC